MGGDGEGSYIIFFNDKKKEVKPLKIKYYQLQDGQYQFQLVAGNGEALMTSEPYKTKRSMRNAIDIVVNRPIDRMILEGKKNEEK